MSHKKLIGHHTFDVSLPEAEHIKKKDIKSGASGPIGWNGADYDEKWYVLWCAWYIYDVYDVFYDDT